MARRNNSPRWYFGCIINPPNYCGMWTSYVGGRQYAADSLAGIKSLIRRVAVGR